MADCKRFPPGHPQRPPHTFSMAEAAYMQARLTLALTLTLTLTLQPAARVLAERGGSQRGGSSLAVASLTMATLQRPPCRCHPADAQAGRAPVARRVWRERRGQDGGEQAVHELPGAQQPQR